MKELLGKEKGKPNFFSRKRKRRRAAVFAACVAAVGFYCLIAFWPKASAYPVSQGESSAASAASSAVSSQAEETRDVPAVALAQAAKPLWIKVDLSKQVVIVYDAKNRVVKSFICSSGAAGSDTPTGTFTVSDRGKSFYSKQLGEGAYYWTRFQGSYLFHSVPFDENGKYEAAEAAKLGTKASHGCVRLATENAKWIYDHIPSGTKVVIQ